MECPECGAENPDDTDFCSLCNAKLKASTAPYPHALRTPGSGEAGPASGGYKSPAEWHGELARTDIPGEREVERRARRFKARNISFAALVLAVIVGVVVVLTVWGNPSPSQVLNRYLTAVTGGDVEQALTLMLPGDTALNVASVKVAVAKAKGIKLEGLKVKVLRTDEDAVKATLVGGWLTPADGHTREEIKESDNFAFYLLMQKGRWYMDPAAELPL